MHNIGNEHDARTILEWVRRHPSEGWRMPTCVLDGVAPNGWEYVGRGSFRSVWRSPEGVAYKVGHRSEPNWNQCLDEIANLKKAWSHGAIEGVRLPRFNSFEVDGEVIVALELIEGKRLCDYEGYDRRALAALARDVEEEYGLGDMHDQNCIVDGDGLLVPIDFGG